MLLQEVKVTLSLSAEASLSKGDIENFINSMFEQKTLNELKPIQDIRILKIEEEAEIYKVESPGTFLLIEAHGGPEYAIIVTDEGGENLVFNNRKEAEQEAEDCQDAYILEL